MKKSLLVIALFVWALSAAQAQKITAAGATFPYPIYSKWFSEYSAAHPGVEINYQSIGSGGGIKQVCSRHRRLRRIRHAHDRRAARSLRRQARFTFPPCWARLFRSTTCPVSATFASALMFWPTSYLAKITNWNDPRIAKDNPGRPSARPEDHRRPSFRRQRHHLHLDRLPQQGQQGVERRPGQRHLRSTGRPAWAARAMRAWPVSSANSPAPSATSSSSTPCRTTSTSARSRMLPATGSRLRLTALPPLRPACQECRPTTASPSPTLPAPMPIRSPASPTCSFPRSPRDMAKEKVIKDMLSWIINSGESEASSLSYAPLPQAWPTKVLQTVYSLP